MNRTAAFLTIILLTLFFQKGYSQKKPFFTIKKQNNKVEKEESSKREHEYKSNFYKAIKYKTEENNEEA